MNIKTPPSYDVSHWKIIPDFLAIEPKPLFFVTKASEAYPGTGYNHTDDKFIEYAEGMTKIDCIRGFYHYFRVTLDTERQAEHFINVISEIDILLSDVLVLDMEETGCRASQMWQWFEIVKKAYPDNLVMLYSRKNILDPIAMTPGEKEYFKKIKIWTAGYPYFPDLYSSVPAGYIPDQSKYGPVWLWQYSSHGKVTGILTARGELADVDLNWISPEFKLFLDLANPTEKEKIMAQQIWEVVSDTPAKVWDTIGGERTYPDLVKGTRVTTDFFEGEYIHFIVPRAGYSKKIWFRFIQNVEPPPPDPEPEPTNKVPFTLNVNGYQSYSGELEKL